MNAQQIINAANGTMTGAIAACALGLNPEDGQRYVGSASLTSDGFLMCDFVDSRGEYHMGAFVGDAESYRKNVIRLADYCELTGDERAEFMEKMNGWVASRWGKFTPAV